MIPEQKYDMFPLHFCQRNIIVVRYVFLYGFKLLSSSKTYILNAVQFLHHVTMKSWSFEDNKGELTCIRCVRS